MRSRDKHGACEDSQDTSTEAERIILTHFSSLSASRALRMAAAASVSAVFCDRFITCLDETLGSGFAVFLFDGGLDVVLDGVSTSPALLPPVVVVLHTRSMSASSSW